MTVPRDGIKPLQVQLGVAAASSFDGRVGVGQKNKPDGWRRPRMLDFRDGDIDPIETREWGGRLAVGPRQRRVGAAPLSSRAVDRAGFKNLNRTIGGVSA